MKSRADAVAYLRSLGFQATERDWSLGATIAVPGGESSTDRGITVWSRMIYLAPDGVERWALRDLSHAVAEEVRGLGLKEACDLAVRRLTAVGAA